MLVPVRAFFKAAAQAGELILNEEGHDGAQADSGFLAVGEAGDAPSADQGLAVCRMHMDQCTGRMADQAQRLARALKRF